MALYKCCIIIIIIIKKQSSRPINASVYFLVIEFVTFRMLYLILCLMCRLQIILEDCLIKLIFLSLQCCCDCLLLLFCWAYISGYMPFMFSDYVCSCSMFIFIKRCLLAICGLLLHMSHCLSVCVSHKICPAKTAGPTEMLFGGEG